ncbi:MAG: hypothetical protein RMJ51_04470 [Candidatus Calescibacterium sp.]|nr:hypothetical protein [Candidatus Calescibacterium sp.]MCX7971984.1 hypothetical protein [bacterium]MDW8195472.1 hypothetical protein [Candidatus Calescibacterium sp.]
MSFWIYFPLNIKNFWIYKTQEKFSNDYIYTKVVINEKIPFSDKVIYICSYYIDDEEIKKESYVVQRDGIYIYAKKIENNLVVFDPIVPFLPYNFERLDWWSWEGKTGLIPTKILFQNKKIVEENVYKIVYIEENKYGKSEYCIFLKKNVGIVREEAETPFLGYISELTDYDVSFDDFSFIDFQSVESEEIYSKKEEDDTYSIYDFQDYQGEEVIDYIDESEFNMEENEENLLIEDLTQEDSNQDLYFEEDIQEGEDENENRW